MVFTNLEFLLLSVYHRWATDYYCFASVIYRLLYTSVLFLQDDTAFEKQSALFALAVSDIVLINLWVSISHITALLKIKILVSKGDI